MSRGWRLYCTNLYLKVSTMASVAHLMLTGVPSNKQEFPSATRQRRLRVLLDVGLSRLPVLTPSLTISETPG
jgi:hypothetical protein